MWSLKVVRGAELVEALVPQIQLPQPLRSFTIGREPSGDWVMADRARAISARHCEIVGTPAGPVLRDLSTNGTFVNGAARRLAGEHVLRDGDRIEIGQVLIVVSGPSQPVPAPPPPPPSAAVAAARGGAAAPGAVRGGDPAAMLAQGGGANSEGLTEMLRAAPVAQDSGLELTKIRPVPAPKAGEPAAAASAAPPPAREPPAPPAPAAPAAMAPPAAPARPAAPSTDMGAPIAPDALRQALARGLGVPVAELAQHDPLLLAQSLAHGAQAGAAALRQLLDHQAQARRHIGSRRSALAPLRDTNPLQLASSAAAAALALAAQQADPSILWRRSADELCAHQDRLLQAFRSAVQRLGAQIEPAALQAAVAPAGDAAAGAAAQARLWQLYAALWSSMGLAPGQGWAAGFEEAAAQHLAAAYDEAPRKVDP